MEQRDCWWPAFFLRENKPRVKWLWWVEREWTTCERVDAGSDAERTWFRIGHRSVTAINSLGNVWKLASDFNEHDFTRQGNTSRCQGLELLAWFYKTRKHKSVSWFGTYFWKETECEESCKKAPQSKNTDTFTERISQTYAQRDKTVLYNTDKNTLIASDWKLSTKKKLAWKRLEAGKRPQWTLFCKTWKHKSVSRFGTSSWEEPECDESCKGAPPRKYWCICRKHIRRRSIKNAT